MSRRPQRLKRVEPARGGGLPKSSSVAFPPEGDSHTLAVALTSSLSSFR
jgi:hypothetical protein